MALTEHTTYTNNMVIPFQDYRDASQAVMHVGPFAPSVTIPAGTILGFHAVGEYYAAYNNVNADGTEVAKRFILQYEVVTDASGNIQSLGGVAGTQKSAPVWTKGYFKAEELPNLDAAALVDMGGQLLSGDIDTGKIFF